MNQLAPLDADASPAFAFAVGDVVDLVNSHGLAVVAVNYRGRLYVPNPTRAEVIGGPRPNTVGLPLLDVRILDGAHRGKLVSCNPAVVRFVAKGTEPAARPKRRRWPWLKARR